MAASGRATWHADVSRGVGYDDVSMAHADIVVDQVNIDPVNGQRSPVSGGPTGQSVDLTDRWDPRVSAV